MANPEIKIDIKLKSYYLPNWFCLVIKRLIGIIIIKTEKRGFERLVFVNRKLK